MTKVYKYEVVATTGEPVSVGESAPRLFWKMGRNLITAPVPGDDLIEMLMYRGADGWELASIFERSNPYDAGPFSGLGGSMAERLVFRTFFIFKREV